MARLILLYFKDDGDAEGFVSDDFAQRTFNARPVGIYQVPGHKPCPCRESSGQSTRGWGNHSKYGWWIHKLCGRVGDGYKKSYGRRIFGALGRNLLEVEKTPNAFRNPIDMVK